jgi:putative oxidoreductase
MKWHSLTALQTDAPAAVSLIRLAVGWVFLSEGIQKFLYSAALGAGRFETIGIPWPAVTGPFIGVVEIVAGLLVMIGVLTRLAAMLLLSDISVAILSTKIPILLGKGFWHFHLPKLPKYGFWSMAHESRVDLCMWLGCVFLLISGAGALSLDSWMTRRIQSHQSSQAHSGR